MAKKIPMFIEQGIGTIVLCPYCQSSKLSQSIGLDDAVIDSQDVQIRFECITCSKVSYLHICHLTPSGLTAEHTKIYFEVI